MLICCFVSGWSQTDTSTVITPPLSKLALQQQDTIPPGIPVAGSRDSIQQDSNLVFELEYEKGDYPVTEVIAET